MDLGIKILIGIWVISASLLIWICWESLYNFFKNNILQESDIFKRKLKMEVKGGKEINNNE